MLYFQEEYPLFVVSSDLFLSFQVTSFCRFKWPLFLIPYIWYAISTLLQDRVRESYKTSTLDIWSLAYFLILEHVQLQIVNHYWYYPAFMDNKDSSKVCRSRCQKTKCHMK
jgi:hypothetical protein